MRLLRHVPVSDEGPYGALVAEAEVTCRSFPHQVVGRLRDGTAFYFRERGGVAAVATASTWELAANGMVLEPGYPVTSCDAPVLEPGAVAESFVRSLLAEHVRQGRHRYRTGSDA